MRVSHGTPLGERKKSSVDLTALAKPTATPMNTIALDARLLACSAGAYPWDAEEDQSLVADFESGTPIKDLAQTHQRTEGAIRSRLMKLGKLAPPGGG